MKDKKYQPEDWEMVRTRYIPALFPLSAYFSWPLGKYLGIKRGSSLAIWDKGNYTVVVERTYSKDRNGAAFEMVWKNKDRLREMRKEGIRAGREVVALNKNFADNCKKKKINEFVNFFEKFISAYQELIRKNMILWLFGGQEAERRISSNLATYKEEEARQILNFMSAPEEKSYSQIEEEEFDKLVELAREKGVDSINTKKSVKDFSEKYFWFPYEYVGPSVWTEEVVRRRVKEVIKKNVASRETVKKDISSIHKEYIQKYKFSSETMDLFRILQTLTLMQDDRKMFNAQTCYYFNDVILKWVANKLKLSLEETRYLDPELVKLAIRSRSVKKNIKRRMNMVIETNTDIKNEYHEGNEARKLLKELNIPWDVDHGEMTEIKGQIANKGKVVGRARILKIPHVNDFKDREIIVTGMTTPDFIPLIKRCSAIVTDEGGITCHAAIISRELNKPCIIGTQIATKVLKTGDFVEVNANKGIVKILKRSK